MVDWRERVGGVGLGRLPLRLRVALAFALTTAGALVGLGLFVQLRVADTLDEHLDETLESQLEQLEALPPRRRADAVERLAGESFAQLLAADGSVLASSAQVGGRLLSVAEAGEAGEEAGDTNQASDGESERIDRVVDLLDEDEHEREEVTLLVRRTGDQTIVVGTSREDTEEALDEVRTQLLIGGPVALGLAALMGYAVAGAALRPIERMRQRAATISAQSRGERLPLPAAQDELHRLGTTLNEMLDRLEAGLERERRFVAEASHELRTPLALMRLELDLALSRPRSPEELAAALASASEETERLIALAEDLLVLASADRAQAPTDGRQPDGQQTEAHQTARPQLDRREVDLSELASDVVRRFAALAAESGRTVELGAEGPVRVLGERERLEQVISNLVDNALRHGDGTVQVGVTGEPGEVVLTVSDAGPGITDERPFDRFVGSGRGLGLSIVRAIVTAHGGSVSAARGEDGTGTRVTVRLPR